MRISVVTTAFNEREYVRPFVERVRAALRSVEHEIVIVDDSSPDGTYEEALRWADRAILANRVGQTRGLLIGIKSARYPTVVTLDIDLENPPELIPRLVEVFRSRNLDLLVACRTRIPRVAERFASRIIGGIVGVRDVYSNFRVYRRDLFANYTPRLGETFGGELLVYAWLRGYRVGEYLYDPPPRRAKPRIGGRVKANLRVFVATMRLAKLLLRSGLEKGVRVPSGRTQGLWLGLVWLGLSPSRRVLETLSIRS